MIMFHLIDGQNGLPEVTLTSMIANHSSLWLRGVCTTAKLNNSIEKPWFLLETPQKKLKDDFLHVQKILVKSESILREPSILEEHPINSSACSDQPIVTYKL